MTPDSIAVIGLGMGRPHLAPEPAAILAKATVLVGGTRQLALFPDHPARRLPIATPLVAVCEAVQSALASGETVCVLADGDPLFFGIGRTLADYFGSEKLAFFPNVTAVATAAGKLGRSWQDLPAVSLHGRSDMTPLYAALCRVGQTAVYTDTANTPAVIAARLLERGGEAFTLHVLEEMGLPGERIRHCTLADASGMECSPLNLVIIERTRPPEVSLSLGMADDALLRADRVFTKLPVRGVSLAALAPRPGDVVWDVGAGTGAVALEASLLNSPGPVLAVERDPLRHDLLTRNIRRTGALTVTPVHGEAPDVLADLPDPDRVFLGGGLTDKPDILPAVCQRLRPGGRLVVNCVLLGSLHAALATLDALGWPVTLTQLQTATAAPLAGDRRLCAQNPVHMLTAIKETPHA